MYDESMGDITRIKKGAIAHCITADYSFGAGIAKELSDEYGLREKALNTGNNKYPESLIIKVDDLYVFNLVTKENRYSHPTYDDLEATIIQMKEQMKEKGIHDIWVPQLGCGKDRLDWKKVKPILRKYFAKDKEYNLHVMLYVPVRKT